MRLTFSLFSALFLSAAALLAVPDQLLQQNMAKAPEVLELLIKRVDVKAESAKRRVMIYAEIVGVERTSTSHAQGQFIHLDYMIPVIPTTAIVNPFPIPVPGQKVMAYLRSTPNGKYRPQEGTFGFIATSK